MKILKNRTVLGAVCIVLSLIICFALTPLWNAGLTQTTEVVRVTGEIPKGKQITADMVQTVTVGGHNLPDAALTDIGNIVGKYATADLYPGDYVFLSKLSDTPAAENAYLYNLTGEMQAISVTVKSFAGGLSGKLISGDIVTIIAPDYKKQGVTVTPPELQYIEVIAVTASSGNDANTGETPVDGEDAERELPSTVTLLVYPEQAHVLAELEAGGTLHVALCYRGTAENASRFTEAQAEIIMELREAAEDEDDQDASDPEPLTEDAEDTGWEAE